MGPARHVLRFSRLLIAAFLLIGIAVSVSALAGGHTKSVAPGTIVEVAVGAGSFSTLVAALQAAELVDALQADGPFTVFAPTDTAFAALPDGRLEMLLKPENRTQLQAALLYDAVPGKLMAADLKGTVNAETLQGATIAIVKSEGWSDARKAITVNGAKVVNADVAASNGVINVIDAVLRLPEA